MLDYKMRLHAAQAELRSMEYVTYYLFAFIFLLPSFTHFFFLSFLASFRFKGGLSCVGLYDLTVREKETFERKRGVRSQ
jgi:hypothetical protein